MTKIDSVSHDYASLCGRHCGHHRVRAYAIVIAVVIVVVIAVIIAVIIVVVIAVIDVVVNSVHCWQKGCMPCVLLARFPGSSQCLNSHLAPR